MPGKTDMPSYAGACYAGACYAGGMWLCIRTGVMLPFLRGQCLGSRLPHSQVRPWSQAWPRAHWRPVIVDVLMGLGISDLLKGNPTGLRKPQPGQQA